MGHLLNPSGQPTTLISLLWNSGFALYSSYWLPLPLLYCVKHSGFTQYRFVLEYDNIYINNFRMFVRLSVRPTIMRSVYNIFE